MKPELKRIEAALQQAAKQYHSDLVALEHSTNPQAPSTPNSSQDWLTTPNLKESIFSATSFGPIDTATNPQGTSSYEYKNIALAKEPVLPAFTASQESNGFVALTNSALAINLLKDLQTMVAEWVAALEAVIQQIQALYEEGPIVDGWLESVNAQEANLANYQPLDSTAFQLAVQQSAESNQTTYRLCGLNEDGQVWCHPCPQEQVPDISWAIVRYQRLRNLLARKNSLESQLSLLTETLVDVHGKIAKVNE